jgi:hypothetical protein
MKPQPTRVIYTILADDKPSSLFQPMDARLRSFAKRHGS